MLYVQASMELVCNREVSGVMYRFQWSWSVLERCPVLYVQASMELVCNREVSGVMYRFQWS